MARKEAVISVCKRCGAVGSVKQPHCVFCGAALDADMQVRLGRYVAKPDSKKGRAVPEADGLRKKVTTTGLLSLLFGILAVVMLAFHILDGGFLFAVLTLIFAVVALCQRKGGGVLAAVGIGLSLYTMFANLFWFFLRFFYYF